MTKNPEQGGLMQIHPVHDPDNHDAGDIAHRKTKPAGAPAGYNDGRASIGSSRKCRTHSGNGSPGTGRNCAGIASLNAFRPGTGDGRGGGNGR